MIAANTKASFAHARQYTLNSLKHLGRTHLTHNGWTQNVNFSTGKRTLPAKQPAQLSILNTQYHFL